MHDMGWNVLVIWELQVVLIEFLLGGILTVMDLLLTDVLLGIS